MRKVWYKLNLLIVFMLLLIWLSALQSASAQWPPFRFEMTPTYENGKITYTIEFSKRIESPMADVVFKISLPEGTRFVEANAQPNTSVDFDGTEITFFTSVLHRPIRDASFVVEVTDPTQTEFTTRAWIAWQGELPGDYLTDQTSIDITKPVLDWSRPRSRLDLEVSAVVGDEVISYTIYPRKLGGLRMWDLKINVPIPAGTTFVSAAAPPPFVANYDGREVSFSIIELPAEAALEPLTLQISTAQVADPFVVTHAWATWKNSGRIVSRRVDLQGETRSGDIVVRTNAPQQIVADPIGDVPLSNYDLTSIALQKEVDALRMTFYTAGDVGPVGDPLEYILYIDADCRVDTGASRGGLGAEHWVRYKHTIGKAAVYVWNEAESSWQDPQLIEVSNPASGKMLTMRMSYDLFENNSPFCWVGRARNRSEAFNSSLRNEWVGTGSHLTRFEIAVTTPSTFFANDLEEYQPWGILPVENAFPSAPSTKISGKLAVPLDDGQGFYNVHIFALPDGQEIAGIPYARQPNFRYDGQRILVNREGGGAEAVYEYNLADGLGQQVSDDAEDSHPAYDPWGNRVAYDNRQLVSGADGNQQPFIYVQCGLLPPHQESEPRCRDIVTLGNLVPAGHRGEILGSHPLWTTDDRITYRGCNAWTSSAICGIYIVPSASTKGFSDGFIPRQLTEDTSDTPADTKGRLIAFTSHREGNWEAYLMDLNGEQMINVSNSPTSNDGLPTISPDGTWVAFVSDRDGVWAIWAAPISGGTAQKLFDLPVSIPWGEGERGWLNERISWGS